MKKIVLLSVLLSSTSFASMAFDTPGAFSNKRKADPTKKMVVSKPADIVCITQTCPDGSQGITGCGSNLEEAKKALALANELAC